MMMRMILQDEEGRDHRASIIHEALFRWHQASWKVQPVVTDAEEGHEAGSSSPAPWLMPGCQAAAALRARRTQGLLWMTHHTATPLCDRRARSMQLQCAARHLYRHACPLSSVTHYTVNA